jgi:peptidoglycan/LPS O-acetylase OafA/YrhL
LIKRFDELDSLRGLAAFSVVLFHCFVMVPGFADNTWRPWFMNTPLFIFGSGLEAPVIFFVLSGFVLSLPFHKGKVHYGAFIIKRIFRIYLPYLVSFIILLGLISLIGYQHLPGLSQADDELWKKPLELPLILSHIILLGNYDCFAYNPVIWTLIHEMHLSLAFPLIAWLVIRFNWKIVLPMSIAISYTARIYLLFFPNFPFYMEFMSVFFSFLFVIGILLAKHRIDIAQKIATIKSKHLLLLLLAGIIFYTFRSWSLNLPFAHAINNLGTLMTGTGSVIFLVLALSVGKYQRFLQLKPLRFLGKISYSLYLYHMIILVSLVQIFWGRFSIFSISLFTTCLSLITATAAYYAVEAPSIRLGKRMAKIVQHENI